MKIRNFALAAGIAAIMSGCATQEEISEVETARAIVAQVESSPMASRAAANVNDARNALNRAEEALEDREDVHTIKHHAYIATRQAQIANEKILTAQAEEEIKKAEGERQTVLANARERDAQQAMSAAEEARTRAMTAEQRAEDMQRRAEQLAQERQQLEQQLQNLKDLNARQTERGLVLTLGDVLFDVNEATLKPGAMNTMDRLANFLKQQNDRGVIVEGHTDSTGSDAYNMDLSRRRADAVRTALVERGVSSEQIEALGKGEAVPVASNENVGGRQQNRRVEIIIPNEGTAGSAVAREEQ